MEELHIEGLWFVGPFGEHTFSMGTLVVIPAGAKIYSTRPSAPQDGHKAVRSKQVQVASTSPGYVDHSGSVPLVRNPTIIWRGKAGYWSWTDLNYLFMGQRG